MTAILIVIGAVVVFVAGRFILGLCQSAGRPVPQPQDAADIEREDNLLEMLEDVLSTKECDTAAIVKFFTEPAGSEFIPPWVTPELRQNPESLRDELRKRKLARNAVNS